MSVRGRGGARRADGPEFPLIQVVVACRVGLKTGDGKNEIYGGRVE